jgi:homoserine kinase type II
MSVASLHPSLADADSILAAWGVGPILAAHTPASGSINATLLLTAPGGAYALRAYLHADAAGVAREHALIAHAASRGIPAVRPIALPDGATTLACGGWIYALFPQASGAQIAQAALQPGHAAAMGQTLAALHLALADAPAMLERPRRFAFDRAATLAQIAALRARAAGDPLLLRHLDDQRTYLEHLVDQRPSLADLAHQVIHGDYQESNLFFADGRVRAIIDWENSYLAPPAWEVVRTLHLVFTFEPAPSRAFVEGYRQLLPLDAADLDQAATVYGAMRAHDLWLLTAILNGNERLRRFLGPSGFQPVAPRWAALRDQL